MFENVAGMICNLLPVRPRILSCRAVNNVFYEENSHAYLSQATDAIGKSLEGVV